MTIFAKFDHSLFSKKLQTEKIPYIYIYIYGIFSVCSFFENKE